jgi:choline-sulfatase
VYDAPVSQVAVLPTLAELCGVPVRAKLDDTSFVPQLRNPKQARSAPVFAEYNLGNKNAKYMIRDGDLKFSFWTHDIAELYDLRNDPDELVNLALDRKHDATVRRLKEKLFAWYTPPEIERTN